MIPGNRKDNPPLMMIHKRHKPVDGGRETTFVEKDGELWEALLFDNGILGKLRGD